MAKNGCQPWPKSAQREPRVNPRVELPSIKQSFIELKLYRLSEYKANHMHMRLQRWFNGLKRPCCCDLLWQVFRRLPDFKGPVTLSYDPSRLNSCFCGSCGDERTKCCSKDYMTQVIRQHLTGPRERKGFKIGRKKTLLWGLNTVSNFTGCFILTGSCWVTGHCCVSKRKSGTCRPSTL